jgi:thioredoxin reductase (NADPH)
VASQIPCDGLFVAVGNIPNTKLLEGMVELDAYGYVAAGEDTKTSAPGVFAAGDVRQKPLRQIVTAAADGAVAAHMAEEFISALVGE